VQTGPVRFFVPYKRRKRDAGIDDQLHKKFSKSAKLTLSSSAGDKTEDATGDNYCVYLFIYLFIMHKMQHKNIHYTFHEVG